MKGKKINTIRKCINPTNAAKKKEVMKMLFFF